MQGTADPEFDFSEQVTFYRIDHRLLDFMRDGILHIEVWAEQPPQEGFDNVLDEALGHLGSGWQHLRNEYRFHTTDLGAVRRAHTEANMEAEIQGQKLTEVITKLKGDLKTVAERNARLLRKMTEMQLLLTDSSRKGLVSPVVLKEALELLKPGGKSKFVAAAKLIGDANLPEGGADGSRACAIM